MAATLTKGAILDGIAELSVIELSELLKEFEEKFGVTAAAPARSRHRPPRAAEPLTRRLRTRRVTTTSS